MSNFKILFFFEYLKKYLSKLNFSSICLCILFSTSGVFGISSPEQIAQKYDINFPIKELNGCANYAECSNFCEDPLNLGKCENYAKQKGFYNLPDTQKTEVISAAVKELGCISEISCIAYCDKPQNFNKCQSFAARHDLASSDPIAVHQQQVFEKAKEVLGCDSLNSCKNFCNDGGNQAKCANFAKQIGISGGLEKKGPGGCSSPENCSAYCSLPQNFSECSNFAKNSGGQFKGPGGCDSEKKCQDFCSKNPQDCQAAFQSIINNSTIVISSQQESEYSKYCQKTPQKCSYNNFCQDNPSRCQSTATQYSTYTGTGNPDMGNCKTAGECYDFCKANPGKCSGFNPDSPRPSDYPIIQSSSYSCPAPAAGCGTNSYWDYQACSCRSSTSGTSSTINTTTTSSNSSCTAPSYGCGSNYYWDSWSCSCRANPTTTTTSTADQEIACNSTSGCLWRSTYCDCSSAQCSGGRYWNGTSCICSNGMSWNGSYCSYATPNPTTSSATSPPSSSCQAPSSGCGTNYYWNSSTCSCQQSSSGSTSCQAPSSGCGTNYYWDSASCSCKQSSGTTSCQAPSSGCGSNYYWDSNSCSCQQSSSGSTSCQAPSSGCGSNYYWDSGSCSCKSMADQCQATSGCSWTGSSCQCGGVQGITTQKLTPIKQSAKNLWQKILGFFHFEL